MILVDCKDGKDGVLPDKRMAMFLVYQRVHRVRLTMHDRTVGINGSRISASRTFCKNRKVAPRIYSLGCCCKCQHRKALIRHTRSFRRALLHCQLRTVLHRSYQTSIISCFNLPVSSSFGQILWAVSTSLRDATYSR